MHAYDSSERELRSELNLEIERSKTLASKAPRNPGSAQRGRAGLSVLSPDQDPKISEVIRFYEDMTNLLIVNVKPQPAQYLKLEEWAFTCVYTYVDVDGADDTRQSENSVHFCSMSTYTYLHPLSRSEFHDSLLLRHRSRRVGTYHI